MAAPKGNQYAKGKATGRPKLWDDDAIENEAEALREWIAKDGGLYLGSFARQRGYARQRLSEFANSNKVFADAYEEAKLWQEEKFMRNALERTWDPGFTARAMARVCGKEWMNSWDKEDKETKASDLLDFIAQLMQQAKAKPDANSGT